VELVRTATRPASTPSDRLHSVEGGLQHLGVVAVGAADGQAKWRALAIDDDVPLRARLAAIRRVRAGRRSPLFAGTEALSSEARLQFSLSAPCSRSRRSRCSAAQTPAACQSRSRRQQVIPQTPISRGTYSHGIPVRSTKMIPASAARSDARGRPPFGFGRLGGSSGSNAAHNSSVTRGFAIRPKRARPGLVRRY
jgi:hypothetical protein